MIDRTKGLEILEKKNPDFCDTCEKMSPCFIDLKRMFYNFALKYDEEMIVDDPLYLRLKEYNAQNLFGKIIEYSAVEVIERELRRIDDFRLGQVIKIPKTDDMKKQESIIDKKKANLTQELQMYLKNVASVNQKKMISEYAS